MTRAGTMVVLAVAAIGAGCKTSSSNAAPATASADTARTSGAQATKLCPMDVPGANVSPANTPDGEALTFTTAASQPEVRDQLRKAVHAEADAINARGAGGASTGSTGSADGSSEPMHALTLPASHASVEAVGEGIRLTVTPNDPADLDRLRSALQMRAERMVQTGTCPPM